MKSLEKKNYEKLVMVECLRKTFKNSFFLSHEYDLEIEGVDPKNESILYHEIGVIHTAMHLMKDEYGYEGTVYNTEDFDQDEEDRWTEYYDQIQQEILDLFHTHGPEEDQWDGKVPPTLYHDLEFESSYSLGEPQENSEILKARAQQYTEIIGNN